MTSNDNPTADGGPSPQQSAAATIPLRIFISYRVAPNAPLAEALKHLLKGSIEPAPEVFVSGAGGLKPSNASLKAQLQNAARRSDAFVAIISGSSKEREWIFFEAGAAWGRDLLYAPVLVGAQPSELPNTISDYDACNAETIADVQGLVNTLAALNGGTPKIRFSGRYESFKKSVDAYLSGAPEGAADPSTLDDAIKLAKDGEIDRALALFDTLENAETDLERACHIRVFRLHAAHAESPLTALQSVEPKYHETATLNFHLGREEDSPGRRLHRFAKAARIGDNYFSHASRCEVANICFDLGEYERATVEALTILAECKVPALREQAAKALVEHRKDLMPLEKLFIHLLSGNMKRQSVMAAIGDLAIEQKWFYLNLYCRSVIDSRNESADAANSHGIALEHAGLPCLAYEAYSKSAALGASVAVCNMASLLLEASNAGAAQKLLREHTGAFDAAAPEYPYNTISAAEKKVHSEREAYQAMLNAAARQYTVLWSLAEKAIEARTAVFPPHSGRMIFGDSTLLIENGRLVSSGPGPARILAGEPCEIQSLGLFSKSFAVATAGKSVFIICFTVGAVEGVRFRNFASAEGIERGRWERLVPATTALPRPPESSGIGSERPLAAVDGE